MLSKINFCEKCEKLFTPWGDKSKKARFFEAKKIVFEPPKNVCKFLLRIKKSVINK